MALKTQIARSLLPIVHHVEYEALKEFAEDEIRSLHLQLELCSNMHEVANIQGQIKSYRRLLSLREEAAKDAQRKE